MRFTLKINNILLPVILWLSATNVFSSYISLPPHQHSSHKSGSDATVSDKGDGVIGHDMDSDSITIYFAGDLMQHDAQINSALTPSGNYDYSSCFKYVRDDITDADIAVGNLEVTIGGKPYRGYPAFSAPDEFLYSVKDAGFDVLLTANNHCLDRGRVGLERTVRKLDSLKISRAGTYTDKDDRIHNYPLLVEKKGFRIVFLNYTYGTNGIKVSLPNIVNYIDRDQIRKDVIKARLMKPDAIIACVHWGVEYMTQPDREQTELEEWLIEMGVNHVIGSHPHVVQPVRIIEKHPTPDKSLIVYSLGNYISNMSAPQTDGGLSVEIKLKRVGGKTRLVDYSHYFVWTSRPVVNGKGKYFVIPEYLDDKYLNTSEIYRRKKYVEQAGKIVQSYLDK